MRVVFILPVLFLMSCASTVPVRKVASLPVVINQEVDPDRSVVKVFPATADLEGVWYYLYLKVKNSQGEFIDSDEIQLMTEKGESFPFQLKRVHTGRYYLTLKRLPGMSTASMKILVQGKLFNKVFDLNGDYPHRKFSQIKVTENAGHTVKFHLSLRDEANQPVVMKSAPEILMEGPGLIQDVIPLGKGVWEFSLVYPEENQIIYLSVRAKGVLLPKLFRFQHIEK